MFGAMPVPRRGTLRDEKNTMNGKYHVIYSITKSALHLVMELVKSH